METRLHWVQEIAGSSPASLTTGGRGVPSRQRVNCAATGHPERKMARACETTQLVASEFLPTGSPPGNKVAERLPEIMEPLGRWG